MTQTCVAIGWIDARKYVVLSLVCARKQSQIRANREVTTFLGCWTADAIFDTFRYLATFSRDLKGFFRSSGSRVRNESLINLCMYYLPCCSLYSKVLPITCD